MRAYGSKRQERGRVTLGGKQCPCCPDKATRGPGRERQRAKSEAHDLPPSRSRGGRK